MFSKTAYYESVDEYVKAMTGWKGNDDSGMGVIAFKSITDILIKRILILSGSARTVW